MKKYIIISILSIGLPFVTMAQFKVPKINKNLNVKELKDKVVEEPVKEAPKKAVESKPSTNTNNTGGNDAAYKSLDFDSWGFEEVQELVMVNGYLGSGLALSKIDVRSKHSDGLDVPVIDMTFVSPCFEQDLYAYAFKVADKGKVGGFDFEADAKARGLKGDYESELIFVEDDKYILIMYAMKSLDEKMDKYVEGHFPELQRRLPNEL